MEVIIWKAFIAWARKNWLAIAIALAALSLYLLGYSNGKQSQKAETAKVQAKHDAYKTEIQKAVAIRLTQNALKEAKDRKVFDQIAKQFETDIKNAEAKANRVAADLRAGNIKLRKHWRGCEAARAAGSPQGIDEATRLREESAGRIIGNAAQADAWIKALQDVIRQLQDYPASTEPEGLQDK